MMVAAIPEMTGRMVEDRVGGEGVGERWTARCPRMRVSEQASDADRRATTEEWDASRD
jgi:hypothetical protein